MKKFLFFLLLTFTLACTSCGTLSLTNRVKQLEIGMTKRETIQILGNDYRVVSAVKTPDGVLEIYRYVPTIDYNYMVHFLDGRLVEWYEEIPQPQPQHHQRKDDR